FFTTKKEGLSVGLGLSVVYDIVLRHRGQIEVESGPDRGAVFTLTFPREIRQDQKNRQDGQD
ncbi:MAG: ATP-binding protein, partial [Syntrophobacteraceae bacterium]